MALSEDERQRIREEELVRLQAREEFRRTTNPKNHARLVVISIGFIAALLLLWNLMMAAKNKPREIGAAAEAQSLPSQNS